MRRFRIEANGRRVEVSQEEFERDCASIVTGPGRISPRNTGRVNEPPAGNPLRRAHNATRPPAKPSSAGTVDDRRRRAAAVKANLAPLLKGADAILEQARLHDIEKSTPEGRAAIARRLKAKYP